METSIIHFNSIEAAKILGVNVSTIKRWTDEGKLSCIKTAGGHRKFLMRHLGDYVKEYRQENARVNLFPVENENDIEISYHIMKGNFDVLIAHLIEHAIQANQEKVQQVLNGLFLANYPLYTIYDDIITPVLHRFGQMWMDDKLTIMEEHFGSQTIRDGIIRLQGIIRIPVEKIGRAVCLNLSSEMHDIALKMVCNILELRGFHVYFSGQHTSIIDIDRAFERFQPQRVYVSSTWIEDPQKTQQELDHIYACCEKYGAKVFIGGAGMSQLNHKNSLVKHFLNSFQEAFHV